MLKRDKRFVYATILNREFFFMLLLRFLQHVHVTFNNVNWFSVLNYCALEWLNKKCSNNVSFSDFSRGLTKWHQLPYSNWMRTRIQLKNSFSILFKHWFLPIIIDFSMEFILRLQIAHRAKLCLQTTYDKYEFHLWIFINLIKMHWLIGSICRKMSNEKHTLHVVFRTLSSIRIYLCWF